MSYVRHLSNGPYVVRAVVGAVVDTKIISISLLMVCFAVNVRSYAKSRRLKHFSGAVQMRSLAHISNLLKYYNK